MMHLYVGENTREAHRIRESLAEVGIASRLILDLEEGFCEQPALLDISFIDQIPADSLQSKKIAVFAGPDQAKLAIKCIQLGAQKYFVRGGDLAEIVDWSVQNRKSEGRINEDSSLKQSRSSLFKNFVCESAAMHKVQQLSQKSAQTDIAVLITGPSGSGKEVIARHIHNSSPRAEGFKRGIISNTR